MVYWSEDHFFGAARYLNTTSVENSLLSSSLVRSLPCSVLRLFRSLP